MLMLLSLLTYTRLETYKNSQMFQLFFTKYMEKDERSYINQAMQKQYDKAKGSKKESKGEKGDQQPKVNANRRISLALLVDEKQRANKAKEWAQTRILLKNLINELYSDQPFFQEAVKERSQAVDELINEMIHAIDQLPKNKKIKKATELSNLTLADKQLDLMLYKMLHGAPYKEIVEERQLAKPQEEEAVETDQEDVEAGSEADEFKSPKGYFSLLDFVNLSPTLKIRVYLAPREVLMAAFHDKNIVDDIIAQRKELYKQAVGDGDLAQLKSAFQNQFEQRRAPEIDSATLDFSVSKTNPKNYE